MNFLVILICLTINYVWLKDFDRFSDSWFFRFRAAIAQMTTDVSNQYRHGWMLGIVLIYAIPLLIVGGLLLLLDGLFFGLLVMLLHILVLLIAFDRTQPGKLALDFLALWNRGDLQASRDFLEQEMATDPNAAALELESEDACSLAQFFSRQLTYRCFEKMFVMFFWYMVAGPLGIVVCYVSYQLRDCRWEDERRETEQGITVLIRALEWIPMRLLMLSFSLAGNFVKCFSNLKDIFWDFSMGGHYADLLQRAALNALDGSPYSTAGKSSSDEVDRVRVSEEIQALQALLERSQLIWLSVLALITLFGINL